MFVQEFKKVFTALYNNGFSPLAGIEKIPAQKWKDPSRDDLYNYGLRLVNEEKAEQIILRLDNGLCALDCDFRNEDITNTFVEYLKQYGKIFTTRGKKGCKVFLRVKDFVSDVNTFKDAQYVDVQFVRDLGNTDELKQFECQLEIKFDLSVIYGKYGKGTDIDYHAYRDTAFIADCKSIDDIPLITKEDVNNIVLKLHDIYRDFGLVKLSHIKTRDNFLNYLVTERLINPCDEKEFISICKSIGKNVFNAPLVHYKVSGDWQKKLLSFLDSQIRKYKNLDVSSASNSNIPADFFVNFDSEDKVTSKIRKNLWILKKLNTTNSERISIKDVELPKKYDSNKFNKADSYKELEDICQRVDVKQLMSRFGYYPKSGRGSEIQYCCPFHKEKVASFCIHIGGLNNGQYVCQACNAKGNVISLVKHLASCNSADAINIIKGAL